MGISGQGEPSVAVLASAPVMLIRFSRFSLLTNLWIRRREIMHALGDACAEYRSFELQGE
jgi:hypothetical protein